MLEIASRSDADARLWVTLREVCELALVAARALMMIAPARSGATCDHAAFGRDEGERLRRIAEYP